MIDEEIRPELPADVEQAIHAVEAAYDVAWNTGDQRALLWLLTDDVVIINPFGEKWTGIPEVSRSFAELFRRIEGHWRIAHIRAYQFMDR